MTATDLLDLTVSGRAEKVRFDVEDATGQLVGAVHPMEPVTISNDSGQQIKRRLSNFRLSASEYSDLDPLTHRVRPYWVLSTGDEYPLGLFVAADAQTHRYSYGTTLAATFVDLGLVLTQPLSRTIGVGSGTTAVAAITEAANAAGIYSLTVGASTYAFGSPIAWPAGETGTTYAKVLGELCQRGGYFPPYFDSSGVLTVRQTVDVDGTAASLAYVDGGRILAESMTESDDLLVAPNRFVVLDTAATTGAIAYCWDIPAGAPNSVQRRGFAITQTIEAPGVGGVGQAAVVGAAHYAANPKAYTEVTFSSPPDPRHDTFDVVNYRNQNYLETKWSLVCTPGGQMTHTAIRVWS